VKANYIEYKKLTDRLFYGVALTDKHMNDATEHIRRYLLNAGESALCDALGIGIRTHEINGELARKRLVFLSGENAGRELTIREIENIGLFLRGGAYFGKLKKEAQ